MDRPVDISELIVQILLGILLGGALAYSFINLAARVFTNAIISFIVLALVLGALLLGYNWFFEQLYAEVLEFTRCYPFALAGTVAGVLIGGCCFFPTPDYPLVDRWRSLWNRNRRNDHDDHHGEHRRRHYDDDDH